METQGWGGVGWGGVGWGCPIRTTVRTAIQNCQPPRPPWQSWTKEIKHLWWEGGGSDDWSEFLLFLMMSGPILASRTRAPRSTKVHKKDTKTGLVLVNLGFWNFRFSDFRFSRFFCWNIFLKNMLVRYRGINNKGVLERPWTKWRVLRAISTTLKCQFTGKCRKVDFRTPYTTKSAENLYVGPYGRCGHPGNP